MRPLLRKQIVAELLMSSGPRKEYETELGEDASGVIVTNNRCFFWIADGTSDSSIIGDYESNAHFSSRLLANELSEAFRDRIILKLDTSLRIKRDEVLEFLKSALDSVREAWSARLKTVQSNQRVILDDNFGESTELVRDFSTTFLCGTLSAKGHLQLASMGDSPFVIQTSKDTKSFRPDNYRFFMRLRRDSDGYRLTTSEDYKISTFSYRDVRAMVAGSDGIGLIPEMIVAMARNFTFREIRQRFSRFKPMTEDDKALCIIRIL